MLIEMRKSAAVQAVSNESRRGFTLTEIAIVLGIVGLILGAIWVAAAAVYNNLRTSKATTELLNVVQNVRALYATSGVVDNQADMAMNANAAGPAQTYIQAGIFPADTLNNADPTQATRANDPWNGTIAVKAATLNTLNDSFTVGFDNVPQQACVNMLVSNVGQGRDPGMVGAGAGAAGNFPGGAAPIAAFANSAIVQNPATQAQAQCNGANNQNAVAFSFKVK